jgi:hypothetical protein
MIIGRSVAAGAVGLLPLPVLDELLAGAVRSELLRRIARARQVDISEGAVTLLADARTGEALGSVSRAAAGLAAFRRVFRRVAVALHVARRVDEVAGTFAVATLFDHYCARHHLGLGLEELRAARLRRAIEDAIADARLGLARRGIGRAARGVARGAQRLLAAPPAVLRRLQRRSPGEEPVVAEHVETVELITVARGGGGVVARGVSRIGASFSSVGESWVEELVFAFDLRWAQESG